MTISASQLVNVLPRVISAGSSTLDLNGVMISKNSFIPSGKFLEFFTSEQVGSYFGATSKEYELAINYFLGFTNSTKKPKTLLFARDINEDTKGVLFGGKLTSSLDVLKTIDDGSLSITVAGIDIVLTGIDLSGATSLSNVALILQTALTGLTVEYSSINKNFIITTGTSGEDATISFATGTTGTDLSEILMLSSATALFQSNGRDTTPVAEMMNELKSVSLNWISFMTIEEADEDNKLAYSTWVNSQNSGCRFVYVCQDSSANAKVNGSETNIAFKINELELSGTTLQYNTANLSAFVMGTIASINYEVVNGRITFAFKKQDGLAYTVNDDTEATILLNNGYNFYGNYSTNNASYKLYQNSKVSGKYKWLDSLVNAVWLNDRLQTNILDLLVAVNSLPYNQISYSRIINACSDTLQLAISNGVITKGISLSSTQKIQLENEAGVDISNTLYTDGYYMQVLNPSATARENRETPIAYLWYMDGGSIQKIDLYSTLIL